jgi:futalosine hydrolase
MSFRVLYITSTPTEAEALKRVTDYDTSSDRYYKGNLGIDLVYSGVGSVPTAWSVMKYIQLYGKPSIAINAGIAGSYRQEYGIGMVVMPVSDCFADAGVEDGELFRTLSEAGLAGADDKPFRNGLLHATEHITEMASGILSPVKAITVNSATGSETTKRRTVEKFDPDIETMEGAAFFYVCAIEEIPFIAVRAISNMVEKRDRSKWNIPLAIDNLALKLDELLKLLDSK